MEGIIKFRANKVDSTIISKSDFDFINPWRQICYDRKYIGIDDDGIGYGNISFRTQNEDIFIISASATGGIQFLKPEDYSTVIETDITANTLNCKGEKLASSESLSHAAVYIANANTKAVLHIHNADLWQNYKDKLPTSNPNAEYGTKAMADAISEIVTNSESSSGVIIMGGHTDGIISYGSSLEECVSLIEDL